LGQGKLQPFLFLEKPDLESNDPEEKQGKDRKSQLAVRTGDTADIDAQQAGQETQRQKNGGNNGEDVHLVVHLFRQAVYQLFLGYGSPVARFIKVFYMADELVVYLPQPDPVAFIQPENLLSQ
jgi:hypothetical protein